MKPKILFQSKTSATFYRREYLKCGEFRQIPYATGLHNIETNHNVRFRRIEYKKIGSDDKYNIFKLKSTKQREIEKPQEAILVDYSFHLKRVMCSEEKWTVESAIDSFIKKSILEQRLLKEILIMAETDILITYTYYMLKVMCSGKEWNIGDVVYSFMQLP